MQRQTDRQTDGRTDRQTERFLYNLPWAIFPKREAVDEEWGDILINCKRTDFVDFPVLKI